MPTNPKKEVLTDRERDRADLAINGEALRTIERKPAPDQEGLEGDPYGDTQLTNGNPVSPGEFTAGELGEPDTDREPDWNNPRAAQGGQGPLSRSGEGNRQADELAELEQIRPSIKLDEKDS